MNQEFSELTDLRPVMGAAQPRTDSGAHGWFGANGTASYRIMPMDAAPAAQAAGYVCDRHSVIWRRARSKFTPNPTTGRPSCAYGKW